MWCVLKHKHKTPVVVKEALKIISTLEDDVIEKVLNMTDEQIKAVTILEGRCPNCAANETKATILQTLYDHVKKNKRCFVNCGDRCDCDASEATPPSEKKNGEG